MAWDVLTLHATHLRSFGVTSPKDFDPPYTLTKLNGSDPTPYLSLRPGHWPAPIQALTSNSLSSEKMPTSPVLIDSEKLQMAPF